MNRLLLCFSFLFFLSSHDVFSFGPEFKNATLENKTVGDYKALVIGIDYKNETNSGAILSYPVEDATAIAEVLSGSIYHFQTVELLITPENTKKTIISKALEHLVKTTKEEDSVLIYYSGHGSYDQNTEEGAWIPSDANRNDKSTFLPHKWIREQIKMMPARHVLLITDSCFGAAIAKERSGEQIDENSYWAYYKGKSRTFIATAGAKEQSSDNRVFTKLLLTALKENKQKYLTDFQLFNKFGFDMPYGQSETPMWNVMPGHDSGSFIFYAPGNIQKPPEINKKSPPSFAFCNVIIKRDSNSPWKNSKDNDELSDKGYFKFQFQLIQDAYLYIFQIDSSGKLFWFFQKNSQFDGSMGSNPVSSGKWMQIPEHDAYTFDSNIPGSECFYIVAAHEQWSELKNALDNAKPTLDDAAQREKVKKVQELIKSKPDNVYIFERRLNHIELK